MTFTVMSYLSLGLKKCHSALLGVSTCGFV